MARPVRAISPFVNIDVKLPWFIPTFMAIRFLNNMQVYLGDELVQFEQQPPSEKLMPDD